MGDGILNLKVLFFKKHCNLELFLRREIKRDWTGNKGKETVSEKLRVLEYRRPRSRTNLFVINIMRIDRQGKAM